jgi:hypothetical protein
VPAGPGRTNLAGRDRGQSFTLPPRRQGLGRRLSAHDPAHRDGHRRRRLRRQPDHGRAAVTAARVGLGAVAPTVLLVEDAAKALIGSRLDDAALEAAAAACRAACKPINDKRGTIAYRTKVAGVLLKRTAAIAAQRAGGN